MNYLHAPITTSAGDVVEVTLVGNAANVMLLNDANFNAYKAGRAYSYHGGYFTSSPVRLRAPSPGRWVLVINLGGGAGHVSASFRVIRG